MFLGVGHWDVSSLRLLPTYSADRQPKIEERGSKCGGAENIVVRLVIGK